MTNAELLARPPGALQAVQCGDALILVGVNWRKLPLPKEKK